MDALNLVPYNQKQHKSVVSLIIKYGYIPHQLININIFNHPTFLIINLTINTDLTAQPVMSEWFDFRAITIKETFQFENLY